MENEEDNNHGLETWVKQVRRVAWRMEDAVDQYILRVAKNYDQRGFKAVIGKISGLVKNLRARHNLVTEILDIKRSVREVNERGERYSFTSLEGGGSGSSGRAKKDQDPVIGSLFLEEAELVGIEMPIDELINKLVDGEPHRGVVSVVGMGGLGKTTVVRKVFCDQRVITDFDCQAWITVSQSYEKEELLKTMIKQFHEARKESVPDGLETMELEMLIKFLKEYLAQKKYLVVFDDVWSEEFWEQDINHVLPLNNGRGGRVLITTRSEDVAPSSEESPFYHVHNLSPLPKDKAWELFCRRVFKCQGGSCPEELKELSEDIVYRCEGLPLAIVTIGGLLSTKAKTVSEWQKLHDSLGSALVCNSRLKPILSILSLSYRNLPHYLKPCFLYFGILPEDYEFNYASLLRLWVAEGFIRERGGMTLEEVAEEYLTELVRRSLVQVTRFHPTGRARKICRVHDLIHELILSRSEELSFQHVPITACANLEGFARRLSIYSKRSDAAKRISDCRTRTVYFVETNELSMPLMKAIFANFKFLTVLSFEGCAIDYIPKEVGNVLQLRYLSARDTKVKEIPKSIGKLKNLETLDLKRSQVVMLPTEINKLRRLRTLLVHPKGQNGMLGMKPVDGIGNLDSLLKLCYVEANLGSGFITELGKLKQLRKLGIVRLKTENVTTLWSALQNMSNLRSLGIYLLEKKEFLDLKSMPCPSFLESLGILGRLESLPDWIPKLKNLQRIVLLSSGLTLDPLTSLGTLPNLSKLTLNKAYDGDCLHFKKDYSFGKLQVLSLWNLKSLTEIIIEEGALPLLKSLRIGPCPQLKVLPSGIGHLQNLERLEVRDMPREFVQTMLPDGGRDYCKVKHIPLVLFIYMVREGGLSYKLHDPNISKHLLDETYV